MKLPGGVEPHLAAGWAVLLFLLVLGLVHGPQLLDAAVILDNTRQYGPPLVAQRAGDAWLAGQAQVHYFHDASPRLYRWLVEALPLEVVPASKLYAVLLLVPLAAIARGLGRSLCRDPARAVAFAVLVLANAVFSNQMLTGTPRDLGTVLFLGLLLALIRRRLGLALAALVPLVGIYPTFGLLALTTFWLALLPECFRQHRSGWALLASLPLTAFGLKGLGPGIERSVWGPTFRLFDQQGLGSLGPLSQANAQADGLGPSVARLIGFQPSPAHLLELLGDKRFRLLPSPGEHAFGWLGSPLAILLVPALVAGLRVLWLVRRGQAGALRDRLRAQARRLAWPLRVLLALAVASLGLYGLSFALAFVLHNPNRYGMMPAVLLLSAVELLVLALVAAWRGRLALALLPWLLAVALPLLRAPVDPIAVPAPALAAVAAQAAAPRAQVLVLTAEHSGDAIANALPLTHGVRVFYAEEMDRGFHQRAIRDGQELRAEQRRLGTLVAQRATSLRAELERHQVSHLLGASESLRPLITRDSCLHPIPGGLALVAAACLEGPS